MNTEDETYHLRDIHSSKKKRESECFKMRIIIEKTDTMMILSIVLYSIVHCNKISSVYEWTRSVKEHLMKELKRFGFEVFRNIVYCNISLAQ